MQRDEWGPWIEHDGTALPPFPTATLVRVRAETHPGKFISGVGRLGEFLPEIWLHEFWGYQMPAGKVARCVAYRVYRPRGLQILDDILAGIDAPAPPELTPAGGGLPVSRTSFPAKTPAGGAAPPPWAFGPSSFGR